MSLTCACPDYDGDDVAWHYYPPQDYSTMPLAPRRRRCCSCHAPIEHGATVLAFERWRGPRTEIEERIAGDEIPLASWYLCESCGDLYYSLTDLGFCVQLGDSMPDLLQQYHAIYLPRKDKEL